MTTVRTLTDIPGHPHANVFPESEPKTIRLTLEAGEEVAPHSHPDREIVFYLVDGVVEVQLGDEEYKLRAGDITCFDGDQDIAPHAIEDATALIVLAPRSDQ
ncbi:MAG: cupin domain-containing protein [Halodesulfurarchaeum sp.]